MILSKRGTYTPAPIGWSSSFSLSPEKSVGASLRWRPFFKISHHFFLRWGAHGGTPLQFGPSFKAHRHQPTHAMPQMAQLGRRIRSVTDRSRLPSQTQQSAFDD